MKPQMVEALYRISLFIDSEPENVFQQIVQIVADLYGGTMAMVNLLEGEYLRCRAIINPHPAFRQGGTLHIKKSLCQFSMDSAKPLLIQNARTNAQFCHHIVVHLKLNRYLGVPICKSDGTLLGTLCFMDDQVEQSVGEEDIQFLSLLAMRVSAELEREQMIQNRIALLAEKAQEKRAYMAEATRFKAFVDCTADAIISFDLEGRMTSWNGGAERIFGYTPLEAIGQSYTLIGTQDVYDFQHQVFMETLQGNTHQWYDTRRRHKDGSIIDVSITTSPLVLEGEVIGLVAILKDITEKVRAARELRHRNEQLDTLAREQSVVAQQLADANMRLKATAEEKRHFVNMVIHDLRHPLTTIRTTLHLIRMESSKKQRMEDLRALENRTRALATLLDELVLYDQIETGRSLLKIEPIQVDALIADCVEEVAGRAEAQVVPVRCEVSPELGTIYTDSRKLKHILLNLVSNALKFTHQGYVMVRALPENAEMWRLEVEDTGVGMSSVERERAFEEYFSGASREQGGIGLGLAIAHRLCTVLQARMSLRSFPGKGTCFQLVFPRRLGLFKEESEVDNETNRISSSGKGFGIMAP